MASIMVEMSCPKHGLERFNIKIIERRNVVPDLIEPKFRTRPYREISGIVIGRNKTVYNARDKLVECYKDAGIMNYVLNMRIQM